MGSRAAGKHVRVRFFSVCMFHITNGRWYAGSDNRQVADESLVVLTKQTGLRLIPFTAIRAIVICASEPWSGSGHWLGITCWSRVGSRLRDYRLRMGCRREL